MPTVPPWGTGNIIKWFSEYELLGNWAVHRGRVNYTEQRRYEYDALHKMSDFTKQFNAYCDAVPDLSLSLQMDWDRHRVQDFDRYLDQVKQCLL
jgi:hypothetical protein